MLCFAWLLGDRCDLTQLRRSAELGFGFAQALLAGRSEGEERFRFAQLAAAQGERGGFFELGWCSSHGLGCEKASEIFLHASELGHVWAMNYLGELLGESDPQQWQWWGRAATLGETWRFLSNFAKQVELFASNSGSPAVVFAIGRTLQGHINEVAKTIFNRDYNFDFLDRPYKTSNHILRGANQSDERRVDSCWYSLQCCGGHSKVDCKIDLGLSTLQVK